MFICCRIAVGSGVFRIFENDERSSDGNYFQILLCSYCELSPLTQITISHQSDCDQKPRPLEFQLRHYCSSTATSSLKNTCPPSDFLCLLKHRQSHISIYTQTNIGAPLHSTQTDGKHYSISWKEIIPYHKKQINSHPNIWRMRWIKAASPVLGSSRETLILDLSKTGKGK